MGFALSAAASAQSTATAQLDALSKQLAAAQAQLQAEQAAIAQLQAQITQLRQQTAAAADQAAVNAGKVDDQEQTKVASGSLFKATLSGLLLMNAYSDQGSVENADVPNLAFAPAAGAPGGNLGATVRQSEVSLRVTGAQIWGAQSSGELIADFYGGLPNSLDGSADGLARLKIARGRLDWAHVSLLFGEDTPLISPLSPTSYASLAVPALGYSGNLWTWTPQLAIEQRSNLGPTWKNTLQAGVMDPLSGQFPASTSHRVAEAGEQSRQPALEVHDELGRTVFGRDFTAGAGTYTSDQNYGFGRTVRAWAVTGDWNLAVAPRLDLSGELFRGRALGGLWGGIGSSIVSSSATLASPTTAIAGLNAAGGWAQAKLHLTPSLEANAAFGRDHPFAGDLRRYAALNPALPLADNRTWLVNVIDHPRSDLILALEGRRITTTQFAAAAQLAYQINAAIGVLF